MLYKRRMHAYTPTYSPMWANYMTRVLKVKLGFVDLPYLLKVEFWQVFGFIKHVKRFKALSVWTTRDISLRDNLEIAVTAVVFTHSFLCIFFSDPLLPCCVGRSHKATRSTQLRDIACVSTCQWFRCTVQSMQTEVYQMDRFHKKKLEHFEEFLGPG